MVPAPISLNNQLLNTPLGDQLLPGSIFNLDTPLISKMPLKKPKFACPPSSISGVKNLNAGSFAGWHCFYPLEIRSMSCDDLFSNQSSCSWYSSPFPLPQQKQAISCHDLYRNPYAIPITPTIVYPYGRSISDNRANSELSILETDTVRSGRIYQPTIWPFRQPLSAFLNYAPVRHTPPAWTKYGNQQSSKPRVPAPKVYQKRSPNSGSGSTSGSSTGYHSIDYHQLDYKKLTKRYASVEDGLNNSIDSLPATNTTTSDRFNVNLGKKFRKAKSEICLATSPKKATLALTQKDTERIELMHCGLSIKRIYVCECLANLYFDDAQSHSSSTWSSAFSIASDKSKSRWRRIATGVPVLIVQLDASTGSKIFDVHSRKLLIRLADLETGFNLWEEEIDAESRYKTASNGARTFHKLAHFFRQNRKAGLSFDNPTAAMKFYNKVLEFSKDLETSTSALLRLMEEKSTTPKVARHAFRGPFSKNLVSMLRRIRLKHDAAARKDIDLEMPSLKPASDENLEKLQISKPCFFQHVTSLNQKAAVMSLRILSDAAQLKNEAISCFR